MVAHISSISMVKKASLHSTHSGRTFNLCYLRDQHLEGSVFFRGARGHYVCLTPHNYASRALQIIGFYERT